MPDRQLASTDESLETPRAAALAGILFAVLYPSSIVLIRLSVPPDVADHGVWLRDRAGSVALALNLVPFAGIAFLWFMGVVRDRIGFLEDQFFSTVFFGSGLLFLALTFVSAALAGGLLATYAVEADRLIDSGLYTVLRAVMVRITSVYAVKMAAVFMISLATISVRARTVPRWLGLAAGCLMVPRWSDAIGRRKLPILGGVVVQLACLLALLFLSSVGKGLGMALCFLFGVANAVHMLAFSTAADVVPPSRIGTSAAIVNGLMFILGGVLIARPSVLGSRAIERGVEGGTLELAQHAGRPLLVALVVALALAAIMTETHPKSRSHGDE